MIISEQDNKLYAPPNGSEKLDLNPKARNQFFREEIGSEIEFGHNNGKID